MIVIRVINNISYINAEGIHSQRPELEYFSLQAALHQLIYGREIYSNVDNQHRHFKRIVVRLTNNQRF